MFFIMSTQRRIFVHVGLFMKYSAIACIYKKVDRYGLHHVCTRFYTYSAVLLIEQVDERDLFAIHIMQIYHRIYDKFPRTTYAVDFPLFEN